MLSFEKNFDHAAHDAIDHGLVQTGLPDPIEPAPIVDHTLSHISRVYCGRSKPEGGTVSESELKQFIDSKVTQYFPDGFTVLHADGGWRDMATGVTITEPSAILEVAHGAQDSDRVMAMARAYKAQFGQQAVMVATTPVATRFV